MGWQEHLIHILCIWITTSFLPIQIHVYKESKKVGARLDNIIAGVCICIPAILILNYFLAFYDAL